MKTTRKQLISFAIALIKEVAKSGKNIGVDYTNDNLSIWFYNNDISLPIVIYGIDSLKENKKKFRDCILKIRGLKL